MPVYNEVHTIRTIVDRVFSAPVDLDIELVIVDDCSADGTGPIIDELAAAEPRIVAARQPVNQGKGSAIARAIQLATGDYAIIQDADLEYDPSDYPSVLNPLLDGRADAVYGSRFTGPERRVHLFWHEVANKALTMASNVLNDLNLTDMETGYKAFRMDLLKIIPIRSKRFGIEPEITVKLARIGARIYEVPIKYNGRSVWEGKKIGWKDGVEALAAMVQYRFFDRNFTTHDGFRTLRALSVADRFNQAMVDALRPHLGGRLLEAGSGIGTLSRFFINRERLVLSELDPLYVGLLENRFGHLPNVRVFEQDLEDDAAYERLVAEKLDSVVCANVLEHIEDDQHVMRCFHDVLQPGGRAVILVPQGQWLYGEMDRAVGHVRRYSREELKDKMASAGFELDAVFDFNEFSTPGWFVNGKLFGRREVSGLQVKAIDKLYPAIKVAEKALPWPGLSVVAVGRRSSNVVRRNHI
jgi:glycosyltransferase involved in cell wall biosynthesis